MARVTGHWSLKSATTLTVIQIARTCKAVATSDRQVTVVASDEQLMGVSVIQIARACELITAIDLTGIAGLQVCRIHD